MHSCNDIVISPGPKKTVDRKMVGPHRRTEAVANIENAGQLDVRSQGEKKTVSTVSFARYGLIWNMQPHLRGETSKTSPSPYGVTTAETLWNWQFTGMKHTIPILCSKNFLNMSHTRALGAHHGHSPEALFLYICSKYWSNQLWKASTAREKARNQRCWSLRLTEKLGWNRWHTVETWTIW